MEETKLIYTHKCNNGYEVKCEISESSFFGFLNGYVYIEKNSIFYTDYEYLRVYRGITYTDYVGDCLVVGFDTVGNIHITKDNDIVPVELKSKDFVKNELAKICEQLSTDKKAVRLQKLRSVKNEQ